MDQLKKEFSDVAVENAIQDLKKIQLKRCNNESLTKLNPADLKNNNFLEEDDNNNFDDNGNPGCAADGSQPSKMRMAVLGNEAMTASCSESESEDPLELIDRLSANGSGDEGTWLYQSPGSRSVSSSSHMTPSKNGRLEDSPNNTQLSKRRSKASPLDWLRRDFDQTPSPEVEKARHSLANKVDEITQGRLDSQTFRIRDSKNQARKSLQELINFSGPHQATSTQTSSHECQTEEAGMQTSFLDETQENGHGPSTKGGSARVSGAAQKCVQSSKSGVKGPDSDVDGFFRDVNANAVDGEPIPGNDVKNLVDESKSRTFTRPKKASRPAMGATRESEEEESISNNNDDSVDTDNAPSLNDLSVSSTDEGSYEDPADSPHLPARVDSSTFTRPLKKSTLKKKVNRNPLRLSGKMSEEADGGVGGDDAIIPADAAANPDDAAASNSAAINRPVPPLKLSDNGHIDDEEVVDADSFNNNKPKIVSSATLTRSAGRRLKPKLQLNESLQENGYSDDGSDSRASSPRSSLPLGEEGRASRKTSAESQPDSRPGSRKSSRSSPVVWDQSNFDKPADMVDVQVIARMQEDSLRRSIASKPKLTGIVQPLTTQNGHGRGGPERNSSLPSPYSKQGGTQRRNGATNADDGYLAKPRIGREDSASSMHSMDSNPGENPSGSDSLSVHSGTPPDSPLGGSRSDLQSVSTRGGLGAGRGRRGGGGVPPPSSVTRRSLPNLAAQTSGLAPPKPTQLSSLRNPQPSLKSHTSDSNLRDKSALRQPTSRLKPPTSNLRAPSPSSGAAIANRSVSPGGIPRGIVSPTPRAIPSRGGSSIARPMRGGSSAMKPAGIPRGGAVSQPPQSRRSGIQVRGTPKNSCQDWEEDYY